MIQCDYKKKNIIYFSLVSRKCLLPRQGSEWYKVRSVASKKMLKMKEVLDFCTDMDKVAEDFISHLNIFRNPQNEIVDLEKQLFKWSMECKSLTGFFLIYMYCP